MKWLMLFASLPLLLVSVTGELMAREDEKECGGSSAKYCGDVEENPLVEFPFRLLSSNDSTKRCSGMGFNLTCKHGITIFQPPTSTAQFRVHDISYTAHTIILSNYPSEAICLESLYLALNFSSSSSSTPFHYACDRGIDLTFVNCSHDIPTSSSSGDIYPVECLSDAQHRVYRMLTGDLLLYLPAEYCQPTRTIAVPRILFLQYFSAPSYDYERCLSGSYVYLDPYSFYISHAHNGRIYLRWDVETLAQCKECLNKGQRCVFKNITTGELGCVSHPPLEPMPDDYGSDFSRYYVPDFSDARRKHMIIGVTTATGFSILTIAAIICIWLYRSRELARRKDRENEAKVEKFLKDYKSLKPTRYSYAEIKKMTSQFQTKLGEGGFGSVFKGKLPNGTIVAVKLLKDTITTQGDEFINEVGTIGMVHHINVVRLLGYCADRFKRALIYEFMPNESLEKFIFKDHHDQLVNYHSLGWKKVQEIAIGIARGIEYLHQGCNQRILHFDIKPHNILLDHNLNPKISDFGFAKLCAQGQSSVSMTAARGTMGYIAPEVFSRNFGFNVSYKSDVYSFGMLLLEMVGGRKNTDATAQHSSQVYFPEWIYKRLHDDQNQGGGGGEDLIATGLNTASEEDGKIAKRLVIVASWCIQWYPSSRPCMKSVVQMLEESSSAGDDVESLPIPPNPFGSTAS